MLPNCSTSKKKSDPTFFFSFVSFFLLFFKFFFFFGWRRSPSVAVLSTQTKRSNRTAQLCAIAVPAGRVVSLSLSPYDRHRPTCFVACFFFLFRYFFFYLFFAATAPPWRALIARRRCCQLFFLPSFFFFLLFFFLRLSYGAWRRALPALSTR